MESRKINQVKQQFITKFYLLLILGFIVACNPQDEEELVLSNDEEVEIVSESNNVEAFADEDLGIIALGEASYIGSQQSRESNNFCASTSWDSASRTLKIDFGDGCVGPYGRERKGVVFVIYSGEFGDINNSRQIRFENYYVNNRQIMGEILLERFVLNEGGNFRHSFSLIDYTVIFPNGEQFVLNGQRTREVISGLAAGESLKVSITGSINGVDSRGRSFTAEIKEAIIADFACAATGGFLRVAGEKEIIYTGLNRNRVRTVKFGDGSCDNTIEVVVDGRSYTVTNTKP